MLLVKKFGGTSVATPEGRAAVLRHLIDAHKAGHRVVAVVSAMGRRGDPYATDTLLDLLASGGAPTEKTRDLVVSCGEILTAGLITSGLQSAGCPAEALTGFQAGILTDDRHGDATVQSVLPDRLLGLLDAGILPVVAGFQGISEKGDITTLGRGGSDTTAAVLGAALEADQVEIFTDVDGIMTTDPRLYTGARRIDRIAYDEIFQMAVDGARVLDHKAVAVAKRSGRPLVIRNTFGTGPGTRICSEADGGILTAIATKTAIVQVKLFIRSSTAAAGLLDDLEERGISLDMINFSEDQQTFTVSAGMLGSLLDILNDEGLRYHIREDVAKVTVVGHKIHGVPGVMRRVVEALTAESIDLLQTSDSNMTIACLIHETALKDAVRTLHRTFFEGGGELGEAIIKEED